MVDDKKHRNYKDKPVNIHRVINLKKQYKQQVNDRLDMVTKLDQIALETEKAKLLKTGKDKMHEKKAERILKKRKHKESGNKGHTILDEEEQDEAYKKQKRMSLYGL